MRSLRDCTTQPLHSRTGAKGKTKVKREIDSSREERKEEEEEDKKKDNPAQSPASFEAIKIEKVTNLNN